MKLKGRSPGQDYIHASYAHVCYVYEIFFIKILMVMLWLGLGLHPQGYKQKKGFIIAQSPMASTVGDFVKMLYERKCGVVVMLCGCEEGAVEVCAQYWPTTVDTTTKHEELLVSTVKVIEGDGITQRLITITDTKVCIQHTMAYA